MDRSMINTKKHDMTISDHTDYHITFYLETHILNPAISEKDPLVSVGDLGDIYILEIT